MPLDRKKQEAGGRNIGEGEFRNRGKRAKVTDRARRVRWISLGRRK
jgi:hypothetical protein